MAELKSQYMQAVQLPTTGLTEHWEILSRRDGGILGWVCWYGSWRQYCFFPCEGTVFNAGCMESLVAFLSDANAEHQERRRVKRG